ncbi:Membrane-bound transcription factor site-1 protease [Echinococcus granulosus]|uniref:Membrane-bound transcription factor site-1 protease n=1 Tax=Echinococcus granulosus TaxID=6210 RepID=W6UKU4_ECHGR|nr:Membrane-bound transcription factor site-1 protease [Echinococcus granulosus]EUB58712.1 Membrane-bound transcription factor site-1 protease [Echinococcus granulosus]
MSNIRGHARVMSRRLVDLGRQIIDRAAGLTESESRSFDNKQKILFSGLRSSPTNTDPLVPVLGLWENDPEALNSGRVGAFGDSSCLDSSSSAKNNCFWLVQSLLEFGTSGRVAEPLASALEPASKAFGSEPVELPKPMEGHPVAVASQLAVTTTTVRCTESTEVGCALLPVICASVVFEAPLAPFGGIREKGVSMAFED